MAEYIEREKVLDDKNIITVQTREYGSIEVIPVDTITDIESVDFEPEDRWISVDEATAADVQPVRYGRWEDSGNFYFKKCSECGSKWDISITNNYFAHYCPRCGADMREPTE